MSFDWRDTLCGGVGSVCCVYAGLPFEVVKLRLQTQPTSYGGPLECFARILRGEGALALWKGATPAVASAMTENAIVFTANGIFRRAFLRFDGREDVTRAGLPAELPLWQMFASGALAGAFSCIGMCPAEVVKCRLQYQRNALQPAADGLGGGGGGGGAGGVGGSKLRYRGTMDVVRQVLREEGVTGLWRGLGALWARDIPFNCVFFGSYEAYCAGLCTLTGASGKDDLGPAHIFLAGGLAGMTGWGAVIPADTIKSRLQSQPPQPGAPTPSVLQIGRQIVREEGQRALWRGWTPAVLRAFPANAALFTGVELTSRALRYWEAGSHDEQ